MAGGALNGGKWSIWSSGLFAIFGIFAPFLFTWASTRGARTIIVAVAFTVTAAVLIAVGGHLRELLSHRVGQLTAALYASLLAVTVLLSFQFVPSRATPDVAAAADPGSASDDARLESSVGLWNETAGDTEYTQARYVNEGDVLVIQCYVRNMSTSVKVPRLTMDLTLGEQEGGTRYLTYAIGADGFSSTPTTATLTNTSGLDFNLATTDDLAVYIQNTDLNGNSAYHILYYDDALSEDLTLPGLSEAAGLDSYRIQFRVRVVAKAG